MSGSLSDFCEAQLLNQLFGGVPYSTPNILYFGYMVGTAGETGPGAEPNSGGYARVAVTNNTTNFATTSNQIKTNATEIQFAEATSNHGLIQAIGVFDLLPVLQSPYVVAMGIDSITPIRGIFRRN